MEFKRQTKQRQVIMQQLHKMTTHPTAAELFTVVREVLPNISLGTIYRNLESLVKIGEIRKIKSASRETRFDPDLSNHEHLYCNICGRVDDLKANHNINREVELPIQDGWEIQKKQVRFQGICPDCIGINRKPS